MALGIVVLILFVVLGAHFGLSSLKIWMCLLCMLREVDLTLVVHVQVLARDVLSWQAPLVDDHRAVRLGK